MMQPTSSGLKVRAPPQSICNVNPYICRMTPANVNLETPCTAKLMFEPNPRGCNCGNKKSPNRDDLEDDTEPNTYRTIKPPKRKRKRWWCRKTRKNSETDKFNEMSRIEKMRNSEFVTACCQRLLMTPCASADSSSDDNDEREHANFHIQCKCTKEDAHTKNNSCKISTKIPKQPRADFPCQCRQCKYAKYPTASKTGCQTKPDLGMVCYCSPDETNNCDNGEINDLAYHFPHGNPNMFSQNCAGMPKPSNRCRYGMDSINQPTWDQYNQTGNRHPRRFPNQVDHTLHYRESPNQSNMFDPQFINNYSVIDPCTDPNQVSSNSQGHICIPKSILVGSGDPQEKFCIPISFTTRAINYNNRYPSEPKNGFDKRNRTNTRRANDEARNCHVLNKLKKKRYMPYEDDSCDDIFEEEPKRKENPQKRFTHRLHKSRLGPLEEVPEDGLDNAENGQNTASLGRITRDNKKPRYSDEMKQYLIEDQTYSQQGNRRTSLSQHRSKIRRSTAEDVRKSDGNQRSRYLDGTCHTDDDTSGSGRRNSPLMPDSSLKNIRSIRSPSPEISKSKNSANWKIDTYTELEFRELLKQIKCLRKDLKKYENEDC